MCIVLYIYMLLYHQFAIPLGSDKLVLWHLYNRKIIMHFGKSAACECDRKTKKMRIVGWKWNALLFIFINLYQTFYPKFISPLFFLEYFHVLDCVECWMPFIYRDLLSLFTQLFQRNYFRFVISECTPLNICSRRYNMNKACHSFVEKYSHFNQRQLNGFTSKTKINIEPYTFPPAHWKTNFNGSEIKMRNIHF